MSVKTVYDSLSLELNSTLHINTFFWLLMIKIKPRTSLKLDILPLSHTT